MFNEEATSAVPGFLVGPPTRFNLNWKSWFFRGVENWTNRKNF